LCGEWEYFQKDIEFTAFVVRRNKKLYKNLEMQTIQELNERKIPIVRINNGLKKYKKMPIFQEKVDKANEMLRTIGLPKLSTKLLSNPH